MSTAVQISLEEYLSNTYEPDCDYVDGALEERNVGLRRHSRTQTLLARWLSNREQQHKHAVLVEQRVKVSATRIRIPDICLVAADNEDELTQTPPALWIEIVSPNDRWSRIQIRLTDCIDFGVPDDMDNRSIHKECLDNDASHRRRAGRGWNSSRSGTET